MTHSHSKLTLLSVLTLSTLLNVACGVAGSKFQANGVATDGRSTKNLQLPTDQFGPMDVTEPKAENKDGEKTSEPAAAPAATGTATTTPATPGSTTETGAPLSATAAQAAKAEPVKTLNVSVKPTVQLAATSKKTEGGLFGKDSFFTSLVAELKTESIDPTLAAQLAGTKEIPLRNEGQVILNSEVLGDCKLSAAFMTIRDGGQRLKLQLVGFDNSEQIVGKGCTRALSTFATEGLVVELRNIPVEVEGREKTVIPVVRVQIPPKP